MPGAFLGLVLGVWSFSSFSSSRIVRSWNELEVGRVMMDTSTAAPAESAQINTSGPITLLSFGALSLWTLAAVAAFQLAYSFPQFSLAIFAYAFCLLQLAR